MSALRCVGKALVRPDRRTAAYRGTTDSVPAVTAAPARLMAAGLVFLSALRPLVPGLQPAGGGCKSLSAIFEYSGPAAGCACRLGPRMLRSELLRCWKLVFEEPVWHS